MSEATGGATRGILAFAGYVPYHRLDRAAITAASGTNAGKGTRAVASYDEDTTTMAAEAARLALRPLGEAGRSLPSSLWFSTTAPSYVDKTNATAVHAALRLAPEVGALDLGGAVRSAVGALATALAGSDTVLVTAADIRTGLPTSGDEREGGDGAAALLVGEGSDEAPVLAELVGRASLTAEFLDRWRAPGEPRSKLWEERFGESQYTALGPPGLEAGPRRRAAWPPRTWPPWWSPAPTAGPCARWPPRSAPAPVAWPTTWPPPWATPVRPSPACCSPMLLEQARPGQVVALVALADGADVLVLRTTEALGSHRPARSVATQVATGRDDLRYLQFLSWNGMVTIEPPRRPEPARASASAAARNDDWKFGFVGSRDRSTGAVHLPPARVSYAGGAVDEMDPQPMAEATGTVATFTVDRLAYSPSPPIVFAVVDFDEADGGGRLPLELTDVDADEVAIGERVEMTFRRLNRADGIQNYFWKAKPIREDAVMSSHGIKDKVAIVGMGCTPFREHWDKGIDDLLIDAAEETFASAGVTKDDIDAFWLGTAQTGMSGITLSAPLKLEGKPVTRVENYCASGSEALRQAAYAVASGAYDVAMAIGVEKVKDGGYQGLNAFPIPNDGTARTLTAAAMFSLIVPAYAERYGVDEDELKRVLARIASKNHHNGARNPRAQFRAR